jgi:hypothetical protein
MKSEDIKFYTDDELRSIKNNIACKKYGDLPYKLGNYILTENPQIGTEFTRALRINSLIDVEIVKRFMNK